VELVDQPAEIIGQGSLREGGVISLTHFAPEEPSEIAFRES
jgi:hypothetical protein